MNPLKAAVVLSVIANLAMAAWLLRAPPATKAAPSLPERVQREASAQQPAAEAAATSAAPAENSAAQPAKAGQPGSLEALVAELRARGFPPVAVRAAVKAQVKAELVSEFQAIGDALAKAPYWRANTGLSDPAIDRARRLLDREVDDRATQLLGLVESELTPEFRAANRRMYGDLPPEKLTQVMRINADYADLTYLARVETQGITLPEDAVKFRMLNQEQRADIERILSPEESLEYYLHNSATANRLRSRVVSFEPTEAEFRTLFNFQRMIDVQFPVGATTADQYAQRVALEREIEPKIAEALGPERYAQYAKRQTQIVIPVKK